MTPAITRKTRAAQAAAFKLANQGQLHLLERVATTLADARRYPTPKLAELYFRRRSIGLFYSDVKTTMHMEVLRTKSPQMIENDLLMHAIAYDAIRA